MKISVVGTGYVGLVSGVGLAKVGHEVTCVDIDPAKVDRINAGQCPIHEPGLDDMLVDVLRKNFRATTDLNSAVQDSELTIIAVGTPLDRDVIDLSQIRDAARSVGAAMGTKSSYHVVAVKSTVVPGTTDELVTPILEQASGRLAGSDFGVAMNPEFLREGVAVADFMEPDRILFGVIDAKTGQVMRELYAPFAAVTDIVETTPATAEMVKYTANALLATLISFSNEIAGIAAQSGVDSIEAFAGVHLDRRFSPIIGGERITPGMVSYLAAGCGFGGSCFPKDVAALTAFAKKAGLPVPLLDAVREVNQAQPGRFLLPLMAELSPGQRVTILGAAFKSETDDVRESPSLLMARQLLDAGMVVTMHDPIALDKARAVLGDILTYEPDLATAIVGADAIVIATAWDEYQKLPDLLDSVDPQPIVADGRRALRPDSVDHYYGVGFPSAPKPTMTPPNEQVDS